MQNSSVLVIQRQRSKWSVVILGYSATDWAKRLTNEHIDKEDRREEEIHDHHNVEGQFILVLVAEIFINGIPHTTLKPRSNVSTADIASPLLNTVAVHILTKRRYVAETARGNEDGNWTSISQPPTGQPRSK
jgi:hypothetical protein